jgi:hypothetical protein
MPSSEDAQPCPRRNWSIVFSASPDRFQTFLCEITIREISALPFFTKVLELAMPVDRKR